MQMNYLYTIILFLSFSFADDITLEQLGKVKEITKDINKASDFSLKSISVSDSIYTLSKMNDKVILINFWATWCGPCRMEIPDFNELYEKYSEKGFEILGISISDTKDQLTKFLKAYKMDYPILYGNQTEMQKIVSDYGGVYSVPMSFLIGKDNQIKRVYPGAILKEYDPNMYSDLIFNIEASLSEKHKEDNFLNLPNE